MLTPMPMPMPMLAPGAKVCKLDSLASTKAPTFDLTQELRLIATEPLITRAGDRAHMLMLGGSMQPYRWTINGAVWGKHQPATARSGERMQSCSTTCR